MMSWCTAVRTSFGPAGVPDQTAEGVLPCWAGLGVTWVGLGPNETHHKLII
jgi:hypothetical protein